MLKLYKGVFAAYMITVIAGLIALCVVFRGTNPASSVLLIFLVFVWIFVCAAVFTAIANTKFGKIRVLFRHCRINESLAKYSALYAKCKDYSYNAILIAYYICSCCLALGKPDEAQKYLDKYDLTFLPASKSALRSLWNSAKTELCLQRGDLDGAEKALAEQEKALLLGTFGSSLRLAYMRELDMGKHYLALARGEDGATEYFEHELTVPIKDKAQESPLRDVKIKYLLAVAYEKLGETEKAREYFDFAAKNGGDTYFAAAAKEKLK